jgi:hypothetical protein
MPHHNTGSEGTWWIALDHGAPAFSPPAEPKRSPRGAARGSRSPERDEPAPPSRSAPAFAPPGSEPAPAPTDIHGLPDAITRLDEDVLAYLFQNDALYDSLFVDGQLDEDRLRDAVATFEASVRGAATYQKPAPAATEETPPLTADGAVDALYDIIASQGVDCIDASRLTLDFTAFGGVKALIRAHGGDKLRWVDVGQHGRVVVVGAGRRSCEAVAPPPTPSFLNRPAAAPAPDLAPSSTGFSAEAAPKPIPAPPDEKPRSCRICGENFNVGWSATENLWILEGCVAASVDDGTTALVHADCRAQADGDVIEAAALIPDPSAPRTVSPRAVSPPPPGAARTINDATVAARTKHILAEDEAIKAQYGAGTLTVRTLRAAVANALGVEETVVKKVVRATLMAQIAADNKPPEDAASAPAPAPAGTDDDWGSASFGMAAAAPAAPAPGTTGAAAPAPAPAPAPARKSRFDVRPETAPAPVAIADVAAPDADFGARLAARAERFGAHAAPTGQRDQSRRRDRSRSRSRERPRKEESRDRRDKSRDKKRKGGDVYVPPSRRQEHRKRTSYPYGERR